MRFADRKNPTTPSAIRRPQSSLPADAGDWGKPLEPDSRRFFERRFDHDFSRVRIHADAAAASSARSVSAAAYTVGSDIVFGAGMYRPSSQAGQALLAHELAHVVQQGRPSGGAGRKAEHESDATRAAHRAVRGEHAAVGLAAPVSMQRQPVPGTVPDFDLTETASPLLASAIGSVTLDGFVTGSADVSGSNHKKLARTAETILKLLRRYPASKIRVLGFTDAVGQESDNQTLGQSRADTVRAALRDLGIPDIAMEAESRGTADPVVKTTKAEGRNRRVEVRFEASKLLRGLMTEGLTFGQPGPTGTGTGGGTGVGSGTEVVNVCKRNPTLCAPPGGGSIIQPIPDITPYHRMDLLGVGVPGERGDLSQTWGRLYWKYRGLGMDESTAVWLANKELSAVSGKEQSRNNPSQADRLDTDMKNAYPDATTVGPGSVELFRF